MQSQNFDVSLYKSETTNHNHTDVGKKYFLHSKTATKISKYRRVYAADLFSVKKEFNARIGAALYARCRN